MTFNVTNSVNSAIVSGQLGLQNASRGITEAAVNIANRSAQPRDTQTLLADVASQQLGGVRQILPQAGDSLTNDLVSLTINSRNAQASAKVLDVVNDTVGRIIDELA